MKVLWLSNTPGLLADTDSYGGGGWISSLQRLVATYDKIELALAFLTCSYNESIKQEFVRYYPIYSNPKSRLSKLSYYLFGYKQYENNRYVKQIKDIIHTFQPDIIHLFGVENPLATILGKVDVPVVVHLQGLLAPCDNSFWPQAMNQSSLLFPVSKREWLFHNGYRFAKKELHQRASRESGLFKKIRYCMGRTHWDYQISQLYAPQSSYFKINEVLRPLFYNNAGIWFPPEGKCIIVSTISETVYKGLDIILKTAALLKAETNIDFEWHVVGVKANSDLVKIFEKQYGIYSSAVNIIYKGVLKPQNLIDEMRDASVYVHPSYIDNSPNSVCEAQMLGIPVIACNVGGVATILDEGKSGILVPANSPFEITYYIKKLVNDKIFAIKLGRAAAEYSSIRHNKESILENLVSTYSAIISENQ